MPQIKITTKIRESIIFKLQTELQEQYECSLGKFEVDNLVDFFISEIGTCIHNSAIDECMAALQNCNGYIEEQMDLKKIYE
tara:strand:- start:20 stop:262 length:243 start_codon:yes stop_codon:yes gene_type:complete